MGIKTNQTLTRGNKQGTKMTYKITHGAIIEADSEEEARQTYVESWKDGYYDKTDLDVKEE